MQYFDKNGKEIKAGMKILMEDGKVELVYDTEDAYGNPNLGINASNEDFLRAHPNWAREFYSLSMFNMAATEICPSEPEIKAELEKLAPIIDGTEHAIDYGEKVSREDYENEVTDSNPTLSFQTAWSAPHPILAKLAEMYPEVSFEHTWADEDIGQNCGQATYANGECTGRYYPEGSEAIIFANSVWGYDDIDEGMGEQNL